MTHPNEEWLLVRRPDGLARPDDFRLVSSSVRAPGAGEAVIHVMYISVDPATRGWMDSGGNYREPIALDSPVRAGILGEVVESRDAGCPVGTLVTGLGSWSRRVTLPCSILRKIGPAPQVLDPLRYLHPLGIAGLTAHAGLFTVAEFQRGDRLLVSAAAGAVGSLVSQMGRLAGASLVVGVAGGPQKCARVVKEFGCDVCVDHRSPHFRRELKEVLADGFDVFFDNVGGPVLEAALDCMAKKARIAMCGAISGYNKAAPVAGPSNLWNLLVKTARLEGFLVSDFWADASARFAEISTWLDSGQLTSRMDVRSDFHRLPEIFNLLFTGENQGKLVIRLP